MDQSTKVLVWKRHIRWDRTRRREHGLAGWLAGFGRCHTAIHHLVTTLVDPMPESRYCTSNVEIHSSACTCAPRAVQDLPTYLGVVHKPSDNMDTNDASFDFSLSLSFSLWTDELVMKVDLHQVPLRYVRYCCRRADLDQRGHLALDHPRIRYFLPVQVFTTQNSRCYQFSRNAMPTRVCQ